jgi:riboflavin kinase/FMN adenylyltransferase
VVYAGVANIGFNPTFNRDRLSVEVHIFDFGDSIYGEEIEVSFIERIRGEIQFQSAEDLVAQIQKDITNAKTIISRNPY